MGPIASINGEKRIYTLIIYLLLMIIAGVTAWNAHQVYQFRSEVPNLYLTIQRYEHERDYDREDLKLKVAAREFQYLELKKNQKELLDLLNTLTIMVEKHSAVSQERDRAARSQKDSLK